MRTERYFRCTDRDRAAFEAGIKLGSIFHQYVGSPVSERSASHLEQAIEMGARSQPYVVEASVIIDREELSRCLSHFGYASLGERMLSASIVIVYKGIRVEASMGWVEELGYPLMRIDAISGPHHDPR
ncbi:MAG: dihydroneopterin aldolase family protein [Candidatus Thermoplasmatota archaeon]|nr:dihydroneopterin aldolase family protein [Candidatus Thermoplasmatota archaeon]